MRERTTWNRSAAQMKQADPYLMNQDHVSQQPKADDYVIGDPSTFAEDVHPSKDTWEAEYAGGQVKRNEIGMAEMRKDTFNHAEKTASHDLLLKKADLCIKTASLMVGAAGEAAVEDQAVALMHMPDADLIHTFNRLANGPQQQVAMQQTAEQQVKAMSQQAQQCLANGDVQAAQGCMAQIKQQATECMEAGDFEAAQHCMAEAAQVKAAIEAAQGGQPQAPVAGGMWAGKLAQQAKDAEEAQEEGGQKAQQKKAQDEQGQKAQESKEPEGQQKKADQSQTAMAQAVAQLMQAFQQQGGQNSQIAQLMQALQQQAGQMPQMAQQAPQVAQQAPQVSFEQQAQGDDMALADMLMMEPSDAGLAEMGIEMEPSPMDAGEMGLGPEDDVLMTLFAAEQGEKKEQEPAKDGQGQAQQKQAMARTASTRTVGTRPSQGVSRVGGGLGGNAGGDVNKLAALWPSAPDVSDAFR